LAAISAEVCHTPLVTTADFITVQGIRAPRGTTAQHDYRLAGLIVRGSCGRRMESCFTNNQPGYRCRHGHTSATARPTNSPRQAYTCEDRVLEHLAALLIQGAGGDRYLAPADKHHRTDEPGCTSRRRPGGAQAQQNIRPW
jgi:hypothetical protein